jgi:hypothetical protein
MQSRPLGREVLAVVVDGLAGEQAADDLQALLEALDRSPTGGQSAPSGDSLSDSPEPMPRYGRPGNNSSSAAQAWAIRTG